MRHAVVASREINVGPLLERGGGKERGAREREKETRSESEGVFRGTGRDVLVEMKIVTQDKDFQDDPRVSAESYPRVILCATRGNEMFRVPQ